VFRGSPHIAEKHRLTSAWLARVASVQHRERLCEYIFGMPLVVFNKRQLAKDITATISRLTDGERFLGHDGRNYWIVRRNTKSETEGFIDVVVKGNGTDTTVASFAVVLIGISQ
jgi:hypothetical protein